jgi:hypothetical protein
MRVAQARCLPVEGLQRVYWVSRGPVFPALAYGG